MSNTYECMVLVNNQEVRKGWQACKQHVIDVFAKHKAEVVSARRWDERRLAYPIKGQQRATYLLVYFKAEHLVPAAIRRDLDFSDTVLRHLILQCEEVPADAHEPEAAFDEARVGEDSPPPAPSPNAGARETEQAEEAEQPSAEAGEPASSEPAESEPATKETES